MSTHYDVRPELRDFEKIISDFSFRNGFDVDAVFRDMLTYFIHGFSPLAAPLKSWRYSKEQNRTFYEMFRCWVGIMNANVDKLGWYDALGDLYMSLVVSRSGQKSSGQFFTPNNICDLMTCMLQSSKGQSVNDPACGSGRLLLAHNAHSPGCYLVGEDINFTCCQMTVCNLLIHGCTGEVICHDSLRPDSFNSAWRVNESLPLTGLPTIREISRDEWQQRCMRRTQTTQNEMPCLG